MITRRFFHVSCLTYNLKRQGIKLNKLINPKSKKQWYPSQMYDVDHLPSIKSLTKVEREPGKQGVRRIAMLNKMFMKHITDLMSTGTVAMDIVGRGIEISKVQVAQNLHTVNVFWVCKGDASDEETERVLNNIAGALRHELSTLRVMGEVPYIMFVKDRHEAQVIELDKRLAIADYGEDYVPTELGHILKSEFTLDTKLSPEMKAKIKQLEESTEIIEEPLPEMTNNVFGLDHDKIMNRLLAARKKTRDAWSNLDADNDSPVISYRTADSTPPDVDTLKQKQELAEFLLKRQILQNKLQKQLRDTRQECQLDSEEKEDVEQHYYRYDDEERYAEENYEEDYYENSQFYDPREQSDSKR